MNLSLPAKVFLTLGAALALLAYLLIVDMGMSAGRIHEGVRINKIDVGGLTREEAADLLDERVRIVLDEPISFSLEGSDERFLFTPADLGWEPRTSKVIDQAFEVGRSGGPVAAVGDRVQAWTSAVQLRWRGEVDSGAIRDLLDDWEARAQSLGMSIDRWELRWAVRRAMAVWPRPTAFKIPLLPN